MDVIIVTFVPYLTKSCSQMYMSMGNWGQAYNEFYEGFRHYQEAGNPNAKVSTVLVSALQARAVNGF